MNISWTNITNKAIKFAEDWEGVTYEKGESQTFWNEFLQIFDINRRRVSASFEYPAVKNNKRWGYIDLFWPSKLLVEHKSTGKDLDKAQIQAFQFINELQDHELPEAIVVCDFANFRFINLEQDKSISFALQDLPKHIQLFGFLLGQTTKYIAEQDPVNRKAAESMAELHNKLQKNNYKGEDLGILLVRLVFVMFAEDSNIFTRGSLLNYVENNTKQDGSDLGSQLIQIFEILNTKTNKRQPLSNDILADLPYVNGMLFDKQIKTPVFDQKMRQDLIQAMKLDWSKVSPAIFGSMFQGVMYKKQRRNLGAHYTSEENILKVIRPLFLDDLYDEFRLAMNSKNSVKDQQLLTLHNKIANLKFLDPACGCGNFLVITYRELRKLEHKIVLALNTNPNQTEMLAVNTSVSLLKVNINQMYGIEIEEFPSLISQTALWLTDHQMNMEYSKTSGQAFIRIPLTVSATIVNANALTKNWEEIINPKDLNYILGNPPFIGSQMMTKSMRQELKEQFPDTKNTGVLDYVCAWYAKSTVIMKQNPEIITCLVSTNSITQGQQVSVLWRYLFDQDVRIQFAHRTFQWNNEAKGNAAVYCVIIGFSLKDTPGLKDIYLYEDIKGKPAHKLANNINGYLLDTIDIFIDKRNDPLFQVPTMHFGNMPLDGGNLILTPSEKNALITKEPACKKYIKQLVGAQELLQNQKRYCLWLLGVMPSEIAKMPRVKLRIEKVGKFRLSSRAESTRKHAIRPAEFRDTANPSSYLVIPRTTSENREYIPMVFLDSNCIVNDSCHIIPNASIYHFGILTSKLHMDWMRTVAGRLKSDYRYSKDIVYNNFVWPDIDNGEKHKIEKLAQIILDVRKKYSKETLANLYDPTLMPQDLRKAHHNLDKVIDDLYDLYPEKPYIDRVEYLFILHQSAKLKYT